MGSCGTRRFLRQPVYTRDTATDPLWENCGQIRGCGNGLRPDERVLELGAGLGLAAVLAARAGAVVVATDVVPRAVEAVRVNAALNGVAVDARLGDCYGAGGRRALRPRVQQPAADADAARRRPRGRSGRGRQRRPRRLGPARPHRRGSARAPGAARPARLHDLRFLGNQRRRWPRWRRRGLVPSVLARETQAFSPDRPRSASRTCARWTARPCCPRGRPANRRAPAHRGPRA